VLAQSLSYRRLKTGITFTLVLSCVFAPSWASDPTQFSSDPAETIDLSQADLDDVVRLLLKAGATTPPDRELAKSLLVQAEEAAAEGRWGPALKLYGESVLVGPSSQALLGYARATARIPRPRATREASIEAKRRDFEVALQHFSAAVEFERQRNELPDSVRLDDAESKMACLRKFLSDPDSTCAPTCSPAMEAIRDSSPQR